MFKLHPLNKTLLNFTWQNWQTLGQQIFENLVFECNTNMLMFALMERHEIQILLMTFRYENGSALIQWAAGKNLSNISWVAQCLLPPRLNLCYLTGLNKMEWSSIVIRSTFIWLNTVCSIEIHFAAAHLGVTVFSPCIHVSNRTKRPVKSADKLADFDMNMPVVLVWPWQVRSTMSWKKGSAEADRDNSCVFLIMIKEKQKKHLGLCGRQTNKDPLLDDTYSIFNRCPYSSHMCFTSSLKLYFMYM